MFVLKAFEDQRHVINILFPFTPSFIRRFTHTVHSFFIYYNSFIFSLILNHSVYYQFIHYFSFSFTPSVKSFIHWCCTLQFFTSCIPWIHSCYPSWIHSPASYLQEPGPEQTSPRSSSSYRASVWAAPEKFQRLNRQLLHKVLLQLDPPVDWFNSDRGSTKAFLNRTRASAASVCGPQLSNARGLIN